MKLSDLTEAKVPMQGDLIPWVKMVFVAKKALKIRWLSTNDMKALLMGGYSGRMDEMMTAIEKYFPEVGDLSTDPLVTLFLRKVCGLTPLEAKLAIKQIDAENL